MILNTFEIRRPYAGGNGIRASRILAAADAAAWPNYATAFASAGQNPAFNAGNPATSGLMRGVALGAHATDPTLYALADGKNFIGHILRDCTVSGPTLADHTFGGRLELPYTLGYEVSTEKADEIEAEGSSFLLLSGTGALTSGTTVETGISFSNGLLYAAQTGDQVIYRVSAVGLTPVVAGALRFRFEAAR